MMKLNPFVSLYFVLLSLVVFPSYAKTPQEAKDALARMKITYSEDAFLDCTMEGDTTTIKLFLEAGMNPNAKDSTGTTALMWAAFKGYTGAVQILLDKGAQVNLKNQAGMAALMWAAMNGQTDTLQPLLAKGAMVDAKDNHGVTALMKATN